MSQIPNPILGEKKRIASLEALRGLAALIVVVWHTMLAFAPQTSGIFAQFPAGDAYTGSFFFVLMNGNGAVNGFLFFQALSSAANFTSFMTDPSSLRMH